MSTSNCSGVGGCQRNNIAIGELLYCISFPITNKILLLSTFYTENTAPNYHTLLLFGYSNVL